MCRNSPRVKHREHFSFNNDDRNFIVNLDFRVFFHCDRTDCHQVSDIVKFTIKVQRFVMIGVCLMMILYPIVKVMASESKESINAAFNPEDKASYLFANNPGPIEELHKKCKDVFPVMFDGAKLLLQKSLSNHFSVGHTWNMSPVSNGYHFCATYVGKKQMGPQEAYPVLLGDTDASGNVTARIMHHLTDRLRLTLASQLMSGKLLFGQCTAEWRGKVSTSAFTLANTDLVNDSGVMAASYFRRVHPRVDVGVELLYQYGKNIPGGQNTLLNYAARYSGKQFTLGSTFGANALHLSCHVKKRENLQFGIEWETNWRIRESSASLGYQIDLPKANVVFRGVVDSNFNVGAVLEKKLTPLPFTFTLSGFANFAKDVSRFGIGLIIVTLC
ncbi:Mitochondrial import receptor subunit TOM40 -like protein [Trichinella pseudospiralis]|uniref:Mitochondrial import receptor subunit TOM40-like protein n=1 Tax=Trichinella pseudospiralis TaxID=6337 RepID=A0A0V1FV14_TRIPS|nr:Mitochondrial import receptor subunit TOM40 -like protein [Trichinella pseudospiralis]